MWISEIIGLTWRIERIKFDSIHLIKLTAIENFDSKIITTGKPMLRREIWQYRGLMVPEFHFFFASWGRGVTQSDYSW